MRSTRLAAMPVNLSPGVDDLNVARGRIGQDCVIGGEKRSTPSPDGGDDQTVGGVGMEATGKSYAVGHYPRLYWQQVNAGYLHHCLHPGSELHCELQTVPLDQEGDFPGCNGRDPDAVPGPRLLDGCSCGLAEPPIALRGPDQRVRIEQDHRKTDQSAGGAAGSNGSSYRNTVPRIIPMNGGSFSPGAGTGESAATGRPRFVIVTDLPSRFISLMMRRHLALNSAAGTSLAVTCSSPPRCRTHGKCTAHAYTMRNATKHHRSPGSRSLPTRRPPGFGLYTTARLRSRLRLDGSPALSAGGCDRVRGSLGRLA